MYIQQSLFLFSFIFLILFFVSPIFIFILPVFIFFAIAQFYAFSIMNLILYPINLIKLFFSKRIRQNHAMEHATVNILEKKYDDLKISGVAKENGFEISLRKEIPMENIKYAVLEAYDRLKNGEKELAYHKNCGTTLIVSNLLFSIIFLYFTYAYFGFSIMPIIIAMAVSHFFTQSISKQFQLYITTDQYVDSIYPNRISVESTKYDYFGREVEKRYFINLKKY